MYELSDNQAAFVMPEINSLVSKVSLEEPRVFSNQECHINATNDLAAIGVWLNKHKANHKTYAAYRREAERLLLWCVYIRGRTLVQLKVEDFTAYFEFLKNPPQEWCITRKELREGRGSDKWRPFLGPLNQAGFNLAVRALNSMFNFLVTANYLSFNPIKLTNKINKTKNFAQTLEAQKYNVWCRMLEEDEWQAIGHALETMPEENEKQIGNKIRTQFLFSMLYFLGLRIHELASHSWKAFRYLEGRWYFFVKGKGDKLAHIPVHDQLLSFVKTYRSHLGKSPLPEADDKDGLLISKHTKKPLSIRQLFTLVKDIGKVAAQEFVDNPLKQQKLLRLSPHWLRHLLASHLDKVAVPAIMIQSILRHSSLDITNIYMHGEELLKHQEIQKLTLQVNPKLKEIEPERETHNVKLVISLTKGPISNELSLLKLLDAIEQVILKGYAWDKQEHNREVLLEKYKRLYLYKQPFIITYNISNIKEGEVGIVHPAIMREANIRLFNCEIRTDIL
jgi:site-specific recombinase XerD